MSTSNIEWTDATWNPVTGCDRVSPGCDNCYAATMAKRLKGMGSAKYQTDGRPETSGPGFGVQCHPDVLEEPLRWRKPRRVFVNSMSDLFHPEVPDRFIADVFAVMALAERHTFQMLTKRPARMRALLSGDALHGGVTEAIAGHDPDPERARQREQDPTLIRYYKPPHWPLPNVWLGVSVEDQKRADERIPMLMRTPAAVRFLSCEPLLAPVELCRCHLLPHRDCWLGGGLHWVIVGGESGPLARPMDPAWVEDIVAQCRQAGVAPFVKQLGSRWGKAHHDITRFPEALRVREFPEAVAA